MRIVAIGDSITKGFPYTSQESWVKYVAQELNIQILNKGVCGDLTRDMVERFHRDVLAYNPTYVTILGGTNDAFMGFPVSKVSKNFIDMVERSREQGIIPIICLPIPSLTPLEESLLADYRDWLKEYAEQEQMAVIDFYTPFQLALEKGNARVLFDDECHPSIEGYKLMGEIAIEAFSIFGISG